MRGWGRGQVLLGSVGEGAECLDEVSRTAYGGRCGIIKRCPTGMTNWIDDLLRRSAIGLDMSGSNVYNLFVALIAVGTIARLARPHKGTMQKDSPYKLDPNNPFLPLPSEIPLLQTALGQLQHRPPITRRALRQQTHRCPLFFPRIRQRLVEALRGGRRGRVCRW